MLSSAWRSNALALTHWTRFGDAQPLGCGACLREGGRVDISDDRRCDRMGGQALEQVRGGASGEIGYDRRRRLVGRDRLVDRLAGQLADLAEGLTGPSSQQAAVDRPPDRRSPARGVVVDVGHERPGVETVAMADAEPFTEQGPGLRGARHDAEAPRSGRVGRKLALELQEGWAGTCLSARWHRAGPRRSHASGRARARRPRAPSDPAPPPASARLTDRCRP